MSELLDLRPACAETARVALAVRDDQLHAPTPCQGRDVTWLLVHLLGLSLVFTPGAVVPDDDSAPPTELDPAWRALLPARLAALAEGWQDPAPYGGRLEAGGVVMDGPDAAAVALDEVVLHGWDLARATGQPYAVDDGSAAVVLAFTTAVAAPGEEWSREGLFGPAVAVADGAPPFERALGLAGRDPGWRPPSSSSAVSDPSARGE
ncbi:TIGR03086 family protein [Streptomyces sp. NP160]|uniref:TIGR03086 family metal-binding protein n=1 Tax=Streptomyces sp. NP160 TaxID=2586637 RepID=UPI001119E06C|nr:TIGR03086 family metal-binding protein [Streptomyces sp. NP160]TNM69702.1 TIGR03086 family protein [Streptomyces sp. NP160]